jgi:hypothetical protein
MSDPIKAPEVFQAVSAETQSPEPGITVLADPTQVRRPWRTVARSAFQFIVALAVLFPIVVDRTGLQVEDWPWLAVPLGVAAFITRVMAVPQVETFLRRFLPFLAAAPK